MNSIEELRMRNAICKVFADMRHAQELYPILNNGGYYLTKEECIPTMVEKILRIVRPEEFDKNIPGFPQ